MNFFVFIVSLFCFLNSTLGQSIESDMALLQNQQPEIKSEVAYYSGLQNDQKAMNISKRTKSAKLNPIFLVSVASMWVYQNLISPQLAIDCPYEITCSNFSKHAIEEDGLIKGILISADRLMRCNPFSLADFNDAQLNPITQKIIDYPCWYK